MSVDNTKWRNFTKPARNLGLQVGEKIFWVSRRRMADLSPVFKAMLFGEFQEATKEIVEISDKDPDEILEMLRCLFPTQGQGKKKKPIDDGNIDLLLRLADEYQIKKLMEMCSRFLGRMAGKSAGEIVRLINRANQYHLKRAVRLGLRKLSTIDPSELLKTPGFTDLASNVRQAISIVGWYRKARPHPTHEYLGNDDYDEWPSHWKEGEMSIHSSGVRCKYCQYETCTPDCWHDLSPFEHPPMWCRPICRTCNKRYGSTVFVCKCVDPEIEAELEKMGL